MQADKKETAAPAAAGKPPSICDRLQSAFHARPAFRPLRRLTVRHQQGDGAAKPAADAGAGAGPAAPKRGSPPVPTPPQPLTASPAPAGRAPTATSPPAPQPGPVRLPAVAEKKAAVGSSPPGPPAPVPPPDVVAGMVTAADAKAAGDMCQQQTTKGKTRLGSRVRKALSSK